MAAMPLNTLIKSYDKSDYWLVRKLSQLGSLGSTYFKVGNPDTNITCTSIYMGGGLICTSPLHLPVVLEVLVSASPFSMHIY